jgi:sulfur-oxidizing protein SoxY
MKRRCALAVTTLAATGGFAMLRPASATPASMQTAIDAFTAGRTPREGRVLLEIAPLVENGNAVPVSVAVQSAMTDADHVQRIALFTEGNPEPQVAVFHLGPHNGQARVATRMRLATSQAVVALAVFDDGSVWQQRVQVLVTLAACVEGG